MKLLFVCLGNICRSPIAEGVFKSKATSLNLNWDTSSAGTAAYHLGKPPHILSQKVCQQNNIDIGLQSASTFTKSMFDAYDLIFALDTQNLIDIKRLDTNNIYADKVKLLSSIIPNYPIESVPDPYYGDFSDYEKVFQIINELCERFFSDFFLQQDNF